MTHVDAIVLAGGGARRMDGADKPMQAVGGIPMLQRVISAVADNRTGGRTIVVGPERDGIEGVRWTREDPPGAGPVAALAAALPLTTADTVLVLAADLPLIAPAIPALLHALRRRGPAAVLRTAGRDNYLAAAWRTDDLRERLAAGGDPRNAAMRALYDDTCLRVDDPDGWGRDVDTAEDLRNLSG